MIWFNGLNENIRENERNAYVCGFYYVNRGPERKG